MLKEGCYFRLKAKDMPSSHLFSDHVLRFLEATWFIERLNAGVPLSRCATSVGFCGCIFVRTRRKCCDLILCGGIFSVIKIRSAKGDLTFWG